MEHITIVRNGNIFNKNINIDLSSNFTFTKDEDINNYVAEELVKAINPIVDKEIKRYRPSIPVDFSINLTYENQDYLRFFTIEEIKTTNKRFINSFFILDYFDGVDKNNQVKLHTSVFYPKNYISTYGTSIVIPFYEGSNLLSDEHIYVYKSVDKQSVSSVFMSVKFFNAKDGKVYYFKKKNTFNSDLSNYYLEILFNTNNEYYFENSQINGNLVELVGYINVINQQQEAINNQPDLTTSDNTEKGDFINKDGNYQSGSVVDDSTC